MKSIKVFLLFWAILFASLLCSCQFESGDLILDETNGTGYNLYDKYEDEYGNKGVVAYVSKRISSSSTQGNKYIVVISADESIQKWGGVNKPVVETDSITLSIIQDHAFGIGVIQLMKSMGIENFPAQNWCHQKNHSDIYSGSWHLPTHYELRTLLLNKVSKINSVLLEMGGDLIDEDALYWTCVEDHPGYDVMESDNEGFYTYEPQDRAVPMTPKYKTYSDKSKWNKNIEYRVRAIKFIYYGK